ncbi:substrate-binding domain-containing protein [Massilia sp. R2A-15]|uniref:substrate-binding domain-containing protein n=1 Tax=Massilia sp. R2A-15 TaxID=3064278 RepID=UPI002735B115|nr:substrate-binding domain-containing protein [Massilia sp. R2A-15]WLI87585.1 substrate-binding domain-containing protein [Massilia sp. R2A-15]
MRATLHSTLTRRLFAGLALTLALGAARAETVEVMNSGGFSAAYKALKPKFEAASGHTLSTAWGPSMGKSPEAIPNRLARGEQADVVIMVGYALDALIKEGKVDPASRTDLADSRIGMVVRAGHAKPDISTVDGLRAAMLGARSIAYSDSASGVYIERELLTRLGIEQQMKPKAYMVEKTPVAARVARGDYELGFQQVSEILPVAGAEFAGRLPEAVQSVTRFAAGIPVGARHPDAARELIRYMASPAARADVLESGLDLVPAR